MLCLGRPSTLLCVYRASMPMALSQNFMGLDGCKVRPARPTKPENASAARFPRNVLSEYRVSLYLSWLLNMYTTSRPKCLFAQPNWVDLAAGFTYSGFRW